LTSGPELIMISRAFKAWTGTMGKRRGIRMQRDHTLLRDTYVSLAGLYSLILEKNSYCILAQ
jgi:hypothetical protein